MSNTTLNNQFKAGFVAILGKPNVGKSTLLNIFLDQKIASVSPRPQTTRKRQLGILTLKYAQIIFIDTPGIHQPHHKLGISMNAEAIQALEHCNVILLMFDISKSRTDEDVLIVSKITRLRNNPSIILVLNKIDLVDENNRLINCQEYQKLLPNSTSVQISATLKTGVEELLGLVINDLPPGEKYFPESQITDIYERDLAGDLIREACLKLLRDEIPHAIAVRIDQFNERDDEKAFIEATIIVERESHKGIVIGQGGRMLKQIGILAREEIETITGRKIFLSLRVKVQKNWRNDEKMLGWLGYLTNKY